MLLNIVLAPVLIVGWGTGRPLGVAGAALASFVAIARVLALIVYVVRARATCSSCRRDCRRGWRCGARMLKIGLPAGAEFALMGVYMPIVYSISRPFGPVRRRGSASGCGWCRPAFMPVVALGFAVSPVAGQNFGARLPSGCARPSGSAC